ncbi:hypothetical protein MN116_004924 [Schistosoma mekongi]|uniref:non-specific serine/threonine protein kinase n=1 Tax=Schistosoma mekongi TaxID=38744 RepID=A0AAE1ZDV4_SCHME|nr:hypothetical protein MN116_004924 [Schistosoma mekongi]
MVSDFSNAEILEYQFIKTIGKGSYGEVWLCRNKNDAKKYVIKKIDVTKSSEKERKAAKLECKLLSEFKHPNIVQYKSSFEYHGFLYIAMGFCEGGDLYTRLRMRNGVLLSERVLVEWFVQLVIALQYMHERNVLHRDLKTRNIFLTRTNIVKLGDLGIARVLESSSSMATTLIGTPYYMSPELYANKPYNHKSDIWALGCVLYEMSTLRHAFNAKTFNALSYKILSGKVPDMPTHYSPELLELMRAMLHIKPEKRPSARRVLTNSFIRKHIILFLEATKDRTNSSWDRSTVGDEVQNAHTKYKCTKFNDHVLVKPASVSKMVNDEKAGQMKQKSVKTFSGQVCVKNSESLMKETLSNNENDQKLNIVQENKSKLNHLIYNASNELKQSIKNSFDTSVKLPYGQYEIQINRPSVVNCFEQLEDNSLLRRLSDARLRRRQRRRMSEVNEEQHSNQQCKHEDQREQTKSFKLTKSNDNNNSKIKLHRMSKIHLHSFSILPVSMLPKLHKRINPVENNSIIDTVIKDNLSNEVKQFNSVRELSSNQSNCIITSTSVVKSSPIPDINQIEKNPLQPKQTNQLSPYKISNLQDDIAPNDSSKITFNKQNLHYDLRHDNKDISNQLVNQIDDNEVEAVVNCLADTLKDGCHPGAPVILPRCKNSNKIPKGLPDSNNCMKEDRELINYNSEDNGPIEPKEETINRFAYLKQRFVELHKECIKNIGLKRLHEAYEILDQDISSESQEMLLKKILGVDIYSQYMSKIWQLKLLGQNAFEK